MSNVFPERMDSDVVRVQIDGSLQLQAIPPVLPAYNKYMGGVDRLSQIRKSYGFDRKSRRTFKPKLRWLCELLSVPCRRSWTTQRKVPTLYGRRNTSTTSYHLCLLLLQSSSLQNPMFCRLPQELKFFVIILFIFIFIIP